MKVFELDGRKKVKSISKGMTSALGIIVGLSSQASLTIFDEPYIGLEAFMRTRFYEILLEEYQLHPRTFIISTHLKDEISQLFEEIIILKKGEILLKEHTDELIEHSLAVSGPIHLLSNYLSGENVVYAKEFAGMTSAVWYGSNTTHYRREAKALGYRRSKFIYRI